MSDTDLFRQYAKWRRHIARPFDQSGRFGLQIFLWERRGETHRHICVIGSFFQKENNMFTAEHYRAKATEYSNTSIQL